MKRLVFALLGTAAIALAGCSGSNQDAVNNAEMNQANPDQLNQLASNAANAANSALGNQQNKLEEENAAARDNVVNPKEADEQNVSGM